MKILFVANRMPYPPFRGDKLKIYNLASQLCEDHELHLITIAENQEDIDSVIHLQAPASGHSNSPLFQTIQYTFQSKWLSALSAAWGFFSNRPIQVAYFRSNNFAKQLQQLMAENEFDVIHVQHLRMSQYFENGVPSNAILDLPDAFSLYWKRRVAAAKNPLDRWFRNLEFRRLAAYEKQMLPKFGKALVCS
ncbi:MAG: hypothetical protein RLZZ512_1862, partial [Bacteroidota bacterium]